MEAGRPFDSAFPIREIHRDDTSVPAALQRAWPDTVSALYVQGTWPVDDRAIAIVGTTSPTQAAWNVAHLLAREAARRGWTVVSGLAHGIDAAAHLGSLAEGGRTIAVVADGHDRLFPADHRPLARRMIQEGGAVVSISPIGHNGGRAGLLLRNQVTSGLSRIVVAGQARAWDGAMATLRHGFRQGRIIAAVVPLDGAEHTAWRGNDLLLGKRSPWREHAGDWSPAIPIWPDDGIARFFEELECGPGLLDEPRHRNETPRETQARLLEATAAYDVRHSDVVAMAVHTALREGEAHDDR